MSYIVLFNGPPRSGKDTSEEFLSKHLSELGIKNRKYKFAFPVKNGTHALYGMPNIRDDHFEHRKESPCDEFFCKTPRQAYIEFSEKLVKPVLGKDFFGKVASNVCKTLIQDEVVIITDLGFIEEYNILKDTIGKEKLILIQIHREGTDFSKDSRSYLPIYEMDAKVAFVLENSESLDSLDAKMKSLAEAIKNWKEQD